MVPDSFLPPDTYLQHLEVLVLSLLAERPDKPIASLYDPTTTFSPITVRIEIADQRSARANAGYPYRR